jgi:hypothetical protein
MTGGLPRYSPKTTFSIVSTTATPTAPSPHPASVALGLIAATRIGHDVDFLIRLAVGVTLGRGTTIRDSPASSVKIPSEWRVV